MVTYAGMVTAEMFQSSQNCDVMQKMTETFDEVGSACMRTLLSC